jgi:hypothetical protein
MSNPFWQVWRFREPIGRRLIKLLMRVRREADTRYCAIDRLQRLLLNQIDRAWHGQVAEPSKRKTNDRVARQHAAAPRIFALVCTVSLKRGRSDDEVRSGWRVN